MVFLQDEEWTTYTKTDYFLAQIAAEIRAFREGFSSSPKQVSIDEFLVKFTDKKQEEAEQKQEEKKPVRTPVSEPKLMRDNKKPRKTVEIGSKEAKEDPAWQEVTKNAQQIWAERLGFKSIKEIPRNDGTITDS